MNKLMKFFILSIFFSLSFNIANGADYGFTYRNFEIDGEGTTLLGGRVDRPIVDDIRLGLGIYLSSEVEFIDESNSNIYDGVYLNYIGGYISKKYYLTNSLRVVPSLFYGVGDVFADTRYVSNDDDITKEDSGFNIIEPGIGIETNITPRVYLELAFAYTMISGTDLTNYEDEDFSGFVVSFTIAVSANLFSENFSGSDASVPDWGKMPGE